MFRKVGWCLCVFFGLPGLAFSGLSRGGSDVPGVDSQAPPPEIMQDHVDLFPTTGSTGWVAYNSTNNTWTVYDGTSLMVGYGSSGSTNRRAYVPWDISYIPPVRSVVDLYLDMYVNNFYGAARVDPWSLEKDPNSGITAAEIAADCTEGNN